MKTEYGDISWERMIRAVEKVRERLERTVAALEGAGIPYAVVGGNAVAAWVSRVDEAAVRNTRDVDILLRRADLPSAITAMESAGFIYRHVRGIDMFLDGAGAKVRDAVHVVFANEKVREESITQSPDVEPVDESDEFRLIALESLIMMKLTSFRRKDQMHLIDMLSVELIDETWLSRFPDELAERLQIILDDPDG